jgi:hypothetical protein
LRGAFHHEVGKGGDVDGFENVLLAVRDRQCHRVDPNAPLPPARGEEQRRLDADGGTLQRLSWWCRGGVVVVVCRVVSWWWWCRGGCVSWSGGVVNSSQW